MEKLIIAYSDDEKSFIDSEEGYTSNPSYAKVFNSPEEARIWLKENHYAESFTLMIRLDD